MATWCVSAPWTFRDTENVNVSAELKEGRLVVQVEEKLTADQWRGQFDQKRKIYQSKTVEGLRSYTEQVSHFILKYFRC